VSELNLDGVRLGRREANKRAKLERIREAAEAVFQSKGFEAATTREIAERAGVALGTLFLYADNKSDLLLLLYDDALDRLTDRAFKRADDGMPLVDQLVAFFSEFFRSLGETPELSRQMLCEALFGNGKVAKRLAIRMQRMQTRVAEIIARSQAAGLIAAEADPTIGAEVVCSLFRTQARRHLVDQKPNLQKSATRLREQFEFLLRGLSPLGFSRRWRHRPPCGGP
jgi:AcrR family transcriptional regulator